MQPKDEPIVSVIIPTTGSRLKWLHRAVDSARDGWEKAECEVLIVLNLNLDKYQPLVDTFKNTPNVSVVLSRAKGVSAARNLGASLAKGKAIRFLDDDDYLYPETAVQQTRELLLSDADLSSYAIDLIDENKTLIKTRAPQHLDCISGLCAIDRLQIPVSFVFKRDTIKNCKWHECLSLAEDTVWLLTIIEQNITLKWLRKNTVVGVWFQHQMPRLSLPYSTNQPALLIATKLIKIGHELPRDSLYTQRLDLIVDAAWSCFLAGFKYTPIKWSQLSTQITDLKPQSTPNSIFYKLIFINPLILSWLLLPLFWVNHALKLSSKKR